MNKFYFWSLQATVRVRNGEVLLNGDFVDDDIVPTKFKPVNDDAEIVAKLDSTETAIEDDSGNALILCHVLLKVIVLTLDRFYFNFYITLQVYIDQA